MATYCQIFLFTLFVHSSALPEQGIIDLEFVSVYWSVICVKFWFLVPFETECCFGLTRVRCDINLRVAPGDIDWLVLRILGSNLRVAFQTSVADTSKVSDVTSYWYFLRPDLTQRAVFANDLCLKAYLEPARCTSTYHTASGQLTLANTISCVFTCEWINNGKFWMCFTHC